LTIATVGLGRVHNANTPSSGPQIHSAAEKPAVARDYHGAHGGVGPRGVALLRERPVELAIDRIGGRPVQRKHPHAITDIFGLDQHFLIAPRLVDS
jgi:hypothetical protein